jgi:hypothetical protein
VSASTRHFVRHYVEMVVAMFLGMAILGVPMGLALNAMGTSWSALNDDAPALMLLLMAVSMTVPMVAWMRYRGHGWRANTEMSASMFLPTFAVIGLLAAGVVTEIGSLMVVEHVAMLLAMLAAMLLRPSEYTGHAHSDGSPSAAQVPSRTRRSPPEDLRFDMGAARRAAPAAAND